MAEQPGVDTAGTEESADPSPRRGRDRRTASRLILGATFLLGILSLLVMLVPFDVPLADGDAARCGPPLFEVVVPADPRFDVVESEVCPDAARNRVVLGAVGLATAVVVAALTERRVRTRTGTAHAEWLGATKRPRPGRRRSREGGGGEPA